LSGTIELGDVVLPPAPLLVAGRVVDPDGRPIAGASIAVDSTSSPVTHRIETTSTEDGTFVLRGIVAAADCELQVEERHHGPVTRTLPPGTRGPVSRSSATRPRPIRRDRPIRWRTSTAV
jgi:hypothetical protein